MVTSTCFSSDERRLADLSGAGTQSGQDDDGQSHHGAAFGTVGSFVVGNLLPDEVGRAGFVFTVEGHADIQPHQLHRTRAERFTPPIRLVNCQSRAATPEELTTRP